MEIYSKDYNIGDEILREESRFQEWFRVELIDNHKVFYLYQYKAVDKQPIRKDYNGGFSVFGHKFTIIKKVQEKSEPIKSRLNLIDI
jgi:hypothetical protein